MKVFITGGSGFVGQEIIRQLSERKHQIRALVRNPDNIKEYNQIEKVQGDTTLPETLSGILEGCDAIIHLVGIIREFPARGITFQRVHTESTANITKAAAAQGVRRILHMSANGTRAEASTGYHRSKWAAEKIISNADLDWTIFRPSLIFGPADEFINLLARMIKKLPLVPVLGDGRYRMQPVSVKNVAQGFVNALETPATIGKVYHCCGPETYNYNELLDIIAHTLGRKTTVCKLHQPLFLVKPAVAVLQSLPFFPLTADQLQMLLEGNTCDNDSWAKELQLTLLPLAAELKTYLH